MYIITFLSLIGASEMELTDVDFSFQKFHWLLANTETDPVDCLTAFGYFKEMNNFFLFFNCTRMTVVDCQFLVFDN